MGCDALTVGIIGCQEDEASALKWYVRFVRIASKASGSLATQIFSYPQAGRADYHLWASSRLAAWPTSVRRCRLGGIRITAWCPRNVLFSPDRWGNRPAACG